MALPAPGAAWPSPGGYSHLENEGWKEAPALSAFQINKNEQIPIDNGEIKEGVGNAAGPGVLAQS